MLLTRTPRVVLVTRKTEYDGLLARHATAKQARFFLETRGQSIEMHLSASSFLQNPSCGQGCGQVVVWETPAHESQGAFHAASTVHSLGHGGRQPGPQRLLFTHEFSRGPPFFELNAIRKSTEFSRSNTLGKAHWAGPSPRAGKSAGGG